MKFKNLMNETLLHEADKSKMKDIYGNTVYARKTNKGYLLISDDGILTRFKDGDPIVYPVGSNVSAHYEHPNGIILTLKDVKKCGIEIEK